MFKLLTLVGLGAGAAYLLDKEKGAQRREQLRLKADQYLQKLDSQMAVDAEDRSNPMSGVIRGARSLISNARSDGGVPQTHY
jgi:hypothetical protein